MSIDYIAVLDHEHLDNGLFLTAFAKSVASHKHRGLILHSDSAYTDRIIQTGVMREEARLRAIKDLNHRLIALFADHGISAIGLNGYQQEMIVLTDEGVQVGRGKIENLPKEPVLLLSSMAYSVREQKPVSVPLAQVAMAIKQSLQINDLYLFTRSEEDQIIKKELPSSISDTEDASLFIKTTVPLEFQEMPVDAKLTTAAEFQKYPDIQNATDLNG